MRNHVVQLKPITLSTQPVLTQQSSTNSEPASPQQSNLSHGKRVVVGFPSPKFLPQAFWYQISLIFNYTLYIEHDI